MAATDEGSEEVHSLRKAISLINTLTRELDIHAAMESVRHVALELLECDRVTLFLVIESRQELRGKTGAEDDLTITVKFGEGIAGTVAQNGGLMNIPDAYSHPMFNPEVDRMTKYHTRSILCVAIRDMSGKNTAVLQALNKQSGPFTAADEQHIQLIGVHLGNTLAKSRFFEEAKREKERLTTLSKCFKRLSAATSLNGALDTIAAAVKQLICADHVVVFLVDHARQVLWTSIISQHTRDNPKLFRVHQDEGVIGVCAANKQQLALCFPQRCEQDNTLLRLHELLAGPNSKLSEVLLQPVLDASSDNVMALLCALNKNEQPAGRDIFYEPTFTPSDCEALDVFSMEVADLLSARSLEVSFASALCVVTATSSSSSKDAAKHTSGTNADADDGRISREDQLSSMLKAQLLDYAPASLSSGDGSSGACQHHRALLQHSHTINVASVNRSGKELSTVFDAALKSVLSESSSGTLRRFSSMSAGSRGASVSGASSSPVSPTRSFHHQLPELPGKELHSGRRQELTTWDLDCATMDKEELVRLAYELFMLSGVLEELDIPESELRGFLGTISSHYHSPEEVPYHNLSHVVQVLHTVWLVLESTTVRAVLSPEEELVLLIAAICHDLDHDGFTNSFHINSQSPLAQRYNDRSVQENHHCALTFAVLGKRGSNLLLRFTEREEFFAARKLLIDAILGTDMHHHFALTQELVAHSLVFQPEDDADRALLVKALLHAADIGNHVRPFPIALANAERVHSEFKRQVAREHSLGLPVSPHMDAPDHTWFKMEVQFIDYVAGPLWERLGQIFPTLEGPLQNMRINRAKFAAMAQSSHSLAAKAPDDPDGEGGGDDGGASPASAAVNMASSSAAGNS